MIRTFSRTYLYLYPEILFVKTIMKILAYSMFIVFALGACNFVNSDLVSSESTPATQSCKESEYTETGSTEAESKVNGNQAYSDFLDEVEYFQSDDKDIGYVSNGKKIVLNTRYDSFDKFVGGRSIVKKDELYGMIDLNGIEIFPCIYPAILDYTNVFNKPTYVIYRTLLTCYDKNVYELFWKPYGPSIEYRDQTQPLFVIQDYMVLGQDGKAIYQTSTPIRKSGGSLDVSVNGKLVIYNIKDLNVVKSDINGYWGSPLYAPLVEIPSGFDPDTPFHWGKYQDEPEYEVIVWNEDIPYELKSIEDAD